MMPPPPKPIRKEQNMTDIVKPSTHAMIRTDNQQTQGISQALVEKIEAQRDELAVALAKSEDYAKLEYMHAERAEAQRDEALAEVDSIKDSYSQLLAKKVQDEALLRECFEVIDFNYELVSIHIKLKERLGL
jgi:phosphopantetheine adenylyltransferase